MNVHLLSKHLVKVAFCNQDFYVCVCFIEHDNYQTVLSTELPFEEYVIVKITP